MEEEKRIISYKGFDENLCCRGFQYEIGKEYVHDGEVKCCISGFHACTNPFDVLDYYDANGKNRFCVVEQSGTIKSEYKDSKQSSSKIKIKAEIGIAGLFKAGVEWIKEKTNPDTIIKGIKNEENTSIGYAAKIGSSGDAAQIGSIGNAAQIGSIGNAAKIGSSGDYAQIESIGEDSVICCAGNNSMAKAKKGSWITLSEWDYSEDKKRDIPVCVRTEFVDGERIKEDTWYKLIDGEFVEQK